MNKKQPFVLAIMGIPGAGKSTLAHWLNQRLKVRVVSRDTIRVALFQPCTFTTEEKYGAFEAVLIAVGVTVGLGESLIVDGMCFSEPGILERVKDVAIKAGANFLPIYCQCPVEVAEKRVDKDFKEHGHSALDRNVDLVRIVAQRFRKIPEDVFVVNCTRSPDETGRTILKYLVSKGLIK